MWRGDLGDIRLCPQLPRSARGQGWSAGGADGQAGARPGPGAGQAGARRPLRGHQARGDHGGFCPRLLPKTAAF